MDSQYPPFDSFNFDLAAMGIDRLKLNYAVWEMVYHALLVASGIKVIKGPKFH